MKKPPQEHDTPMHAAMALAIRREHEHMQKSGHSAHRYTGKKGPPSEADQKNWLKAADLAMSYGLEATMFVRTLRNSMTANYLSSQHYCGPAAVKILKRHMANSPGLRALAAKAAVVRAADTSGAVVPAISEGDASPGDELPDSTFAEIFMNGTKGIMDTFQRLSGTTEPTRENQRLLSDPVVDMEPTARLVMGWAIPAVRQRFGWVLDRLACDPERREVLLNAGVNVDEMLAWYEENQETIDKPIYGKA